MKFFVSLILTALVSFAVCLYLPWYCIAIVAFGIAVLIPQRPFKAFLAGFLSLFLLWGGLSWWINNGNEGILAHKVSVLILHMDSPLLLVLVTAIIGALVGGFAALTGSYIRVSNQQPA